MERDNEAVEARIRAAARIKVLRRLSWSAAAIAFPVGFYLGLNVNAQAGATLWILTAVLILAPFIDHRNKWQ